MKMNFGFDIKEPSTLRGIIWVATAIGGGVMVSQGKSVDQLLLLAAAITGSMGVAIKDKWFMYEWKIQFFWKHEPVNAGLYIIEADDLPGAMHKLQDIIHDGNAPSFYDYWSLLTL